MEAAEPDDEGGILPETTLPEQPPQRKQKRGSRFMAGLFGFIEIFIFGGALVAIAAPYWLGEWRIFRCSASSLHG